MLISRDGLVPTYTYRKSRSGLKLEIASDWGWGFQKLFGPIEYRRWALSNITFYISFSNTYGLTRVVIPHKNCDGIIFPYIYQGRTNDVFNACQVSAVQKWPWKNEWPSPPPPPRQVVRCDFSIFLESMPSKRNVIFNRIRKHGNPDPVAPCHSTLLFVYIDVRPRIVL